LASKHTPSCWKKYLKDVVVKWIVGGFLTATAYFMASQGMDYGYDDLDFFHRQNKLLSGHLEKIKIKIIKQLSFADERVI
jgi:hypothetical protein